MIATSSGAPVNAVAAINVNWSLKGANAHMVAGTWHVHANLESIGPGPELSLVDFADSACSSLTLPNAFVA